QAREDEEGFDGPAVAVGEAGVAVAYRRAAGRGGPREIWATWLDPATGRARRGPVRIAAGDVGAPTLLVSDGGMHVVHASRATRGAAYQLVEHLWPAAGEPQPPSPLEVPSGAALAPALARIGSQVALAWMDAKTERDGVVYAGFGATVAEAAARGVPRSEAEATNARDPEWGEAGSRALLGWTEHGARRSIRTTWCGAGASR